MSALSLALIIALTTVLIAEFVNGWTDAPNAIATVVATGVMSPKSAILMAVIMNTIGAMSGTAVAKTVGQGIVVPAVLTLPAITAAMLSIIAWGTFAARVGMPVSKSHALLAGLAGAGFAGGGLDALQWAGWLKVIIGMVLSIALGSLAALLLGILITWLAGGTKPGRSKPLFDRLSIVAACFMAFNHGLNDGQKFMGVFAMTLFAGGAISEFYIPYWVIFICALTMGIGTSAGGWRIIKTVGARMTKLDSWQGFAAQTAAGFTIFGASAYGIPLSTTHTITSGIVGAAASRRVSDVRWSVLLRIVLAWIVTFPVCAVIAFVTALIANALFAG
ncbi:MAG: inorganic phosphate transporter [Hyphomicrobium sp.]|jgi:PiT family inorganic phosphate transporter